MKKSAVYKKFTASITGRLKVKGQEKKCHANINKKKGVAISISDTIHSKENY